MNALRPDLKAGFLGLSLLCVVIATAAIGDYSIRSSNRAAGRIITDYYPARDNLLFMDRDLYQAQIALERASRLADADDRAAQIAIYEENRLQTQQRFEDYVARTSDLDQATPVAIYLGYREDWIESAERLKKGLSLGPDASHLDPLVAQTTAVFAEMRFALDRITESIMNPLLQAGSEMVTQARDARRAMLLTLIVALVIGASATVSGVAAIRRQYHVMIAERDQRDRASRISD